MFFDITMKVRPRRGVNLIEAKEHALDRDSLSLGGPWGDWFIPQSHGLATIKADSEEQALAIFWSCPL